MRSAANGHSAASGHGTSNASGPAGPYQLTICGIPLNPVPPQWQDQLIDFGP